ncbi:flavin reductase like domain-containing protein, partial [Kalaharituber pfeilii]
MIIDRNHDLLQNAIRAFRSNNISDHLRAVMRHMIHPVVIITTSVSPSPADWRGITLSSFNSLSLTPNPLISFNIRQPSSAAHAMKHRGEFIVHAMLPTPRSSDFAARFAQPYVPGETWKYKVREGSVVLNEGQFGKIPVKVNEDTRQMPALTEEVMFRMYCQTHRVYPVQDHEIWVAKV